MGVMTNGDEDIRQRVLAFSLEEAEGPDRDVIKACCEAFGRHSAAFWGGELQPVPILITPPTSAHAQADAAEYSGFGCRQQMRIRPACARGAYPTGVVKPGGWRMRPGHDFADRLLWRGDLILHEAVHLWLNQIEAEGRHEHKGHGKPFTAECNRISGLLGLPQVRARRRRGEPRELPISPEWPFCVRPGGEFGGFYGTLWERVDGEVEPPEAPATQLEKLIAIWEHETTTDVDRAAFGRRYGLVEFAYGHVVEPAPTGTEVGRARRKRDAGGTVDGDTWQPPTVLIAAPVEPEPEPEPDPEPEPEVEPEPEPVRATGKAGKPRVPKRATLEKRAAALREKIKHERDGPHGMGWGGGYRSQSTRRARVYRLEAKLRDVEAALAPAPKGGTVDGDGREGGSDHD
jgi:hypothetical protein